MTGRVVTFYSYKGGVGRTFALANIAVVLAEWGFRVLVVDWDIEAPGLIHYFSDDRKDSTPGVVDFLIDVSEDTRRPAFDYYRRIPSLKASGSVSIMTAHPPHGLDYTSYIQNIDWDNLYERHALGQRVEELRAEWVEEFDWIFVDSRTGITDFSGLTTAQLPDILAFLFTANEQSLSGCAAVANRAMEARRRLPVDRPALIPIPIPARFEQREEYERAQTWRKRFQTALKPFFANWAPVHSDTLKLIDLLTIPYVPRWTFGEDLAVLAEPPDHSGVRSPSHPASYACETIAALLVHQFSKVDLLTSSRDEFVHAARTMVRDKRGADSTPLLLFISTGGGKMADRIGRLTEQSLLKHLGRPLQVIFGHKAFGPGDDAAHSVAAQMDAADAFLIVVDVDLPKSHGQREEIEQILRHSLRGSRPKPVVPVVLPGAEEIFHRSFLSSYQAVFLKNTDTHEALDQLTRRLAKQLSIVAA